MDDRAERTYDCIAVGEALVDLISTQYANSLEQVSSFDMHPGGSPANLGGNLARLGRKVKFVGSIGNDGAGQLIQASLSSTGLELSDLRKDSRPSSLILVTNRMICLLLRPIGKRMLRFCPLSFLPIR